MEPEKWPEVKAIGAGGEWWAVALQKPWREHSLRGGWSGALWGWHCLLVTLCPRITMCPHGPLLWVYAQCWWPGGGQIQACLINENILLEGRPPSDQGFVPGGANCTKMILSSKTHSLKSDAFFDIHRVSVPSPLAHVESLSPHPI